MTNQEGNERWLPVVGYEGIYEVSDHGRVRSLDRVMPMRSARGRICARRHKGQLIKSHALKARGGHHTLLLHREGRYEGAYVHQLVLFAFVGPRPTGNVARHLNGDPSNNRLGNLAWGTPSENAQDMIRHGTNGLARRELCDYGHPFSGPNLYVNKKTGRRVCRACSANNTRRYQQRLKEKTA